MSTRAKLSVMMFLEFFIWGAWYPLVFGYLPSLGFSATEPPPGAEVSAEIVSQKSATLWLEKSNGAAILVYVDVEGRRRDAVARHRLHVAEERDEPPGSRVLADVTHGDGESRRRVQERRIVRER